MHWKAVIILSLLTAIGAGLSAGLLRMSPVNRAGSVSEVSPRHSFRLRKIFDVFIWEALIREKKRGAGSVPWVTLLELSLTDIQSVSRHFNLMKLITVKFLLNHYSPKCDGNIVERRFRPIKWNECAIMRSRYTRVSVAILSYAYLSNVFSQRELIHICNMYIKYL